MFTALSRWQHQSRATRKIINALLSHYHIAPHYQPIARQKIQRAVHNMTHDQRGQWILHCTKYSYDELSITHRNKQYIIDRRLLLMSLDSVGLLIVQIHRISGSRRLSTTTDDFA